jgi:hypothetical protein
MGRLGIVEPQNDPARTEVGEIENEVAAASQDAGKIARRDNPDRDPVTQREQNGDAALGPIDCQRAALVGRQPQIAGVEFRMVQRKLAADRLAVVDGGASKPAGEPDDQDDESYSGERQNQVQRAHDSGTSRAGECRDRPTGPRNNRLGPCRRQP